LGLSSVISKKAFYLSRLQTGYLYHYTLLILTGLTLILGMRQFWSVLGSYTDFKVFVLFGFVSLFLIENLNKKRKLLL